MATSSAATVLIGVGACLLVAIGCTSPAAPIDVSGTYLAGRRGFWSKDYVLRPDGSALVVASGDGRASDPESRNLLRQYEEGVDGRWELLDGKLLVESSARALDGGAHVTRQELHVVPFDRRVYFVGEDEMLDFCEAVNLGIEPRQVMRGKFLLREGDWDKPASGKPRVPPAWTKHLLDEVIRSQVVGRCEDGSFTIDAGARHGLFEGMRLLAQEVETTRGPRSVWVRVVRVLTDEACVEYMYGNDHGEFPVALPVGTSITSRDSRVPP